MKHHFDNGDIPGERVGRLNKNTSTSVLPKTSMILWCYFACCLACTEFFLKITTPKHRAGPETLGYDVLYAHMWYTREAHKHTRTVVHQNLPVGHLFEPTHERDENVEIEADTHVSSGRMRVWSLVRQSLHAMPSPAQALL